MVLEKKFRKCINPDFGIMYFFVPKKIQNLPAHFFKQGFMLWENIQKIGFGGHFEV